MIPRLFQKIRRLVLICFLLITGWTILILQHEYYNQVHSNSSIKGLGTGVAKNARALFALVPGLLILEFEWT